jgi:cytochrome P450
VTDTADPQVGEPQVPEQPYPLWADLRDTCPVLPVETWGRTSFFVHRWVDVEAVLRDNETFSSRVNLDTMGPVMGEKVLIAMDGAEHRRYRDLVAKAFRQSALARWEVELVAPTIHAQIDQFASRGRADLVADLTYAYPVKIIAAILGVPVADYDKFQKWADGINKGPTDWSASVPASQAMAEYLLPVIEDRRASPRDDLISDLVSAEVDGQRLDDDELLSFLRLLLPAGAETTFRMFGNCLYFLLTVPGAYEEVLADRSLVHHVIEETLRVESSVTMVNREPVHDVELAGTPIPAGSSVVLLTGSANHDAAHWDDADAWDIHRPPKHHISFGTGRHQCLGMHLARLELRVGLDAVLDRLPNLRLDPDGPEPAIRGFAFRDPESLHVLFDPS